MSKNFGPASYKLDATRAALNESIARQRMAARAAIEAAGVVAKRDGDYRLIAERAFADKSGACRG